MTLMLEVKNLCHRFDGLSLFKDLSFKVSGSSCTGIVGENGSGKTTLLNILASFISPGERIITIEDAAELNLPQEHVIRLETRPPGARPVRRRI